MSANRWLRAAVVALLALDVGLAVFWHPLPPAHLRELGSPSPAGAGGDFVLQSAQGPLALTDLRGRAVLLYFGYTYCPDVCPTSLLAITEALRSLTGDELAQTRVVFVSVDPQRDTVSHLADYVGFFHPAMIGVTGDREQIDDVVRRYGASYTLQPPSNGSHYVVDHSAQTYFIDRNGKLAFTLPHGAEPEKVAASIRTLLSSPTQGTSQ